MMQIEQEKLGKQLKELHDQKRELERIDINSNGRTITKGSLVKTDKGDLFISIGLGKIKTEENTVIAISTSSPLAKKLLGKTTQDKIEMNGTIYTIQMIQ
jgi:transcription elongation GreA/GreB family factor